MDIDLVFIQENCEFDNKPFFIERLSGGDINEVFLIEETDRKWVVKRNNRLTFPEMLSKEYNALQFLTEDKSLNYPKPLAHFTDNKYQYLVIAYHEKGPNDNKGQAKLGIQLAQQHSLSAETFGWHEDNYIGSLPQDNRPSTTWSDFYANNRLLAQTKLAYDKRLVGKEFLIKMERFCLQLDEVFPNEMPALLHGDLWGGNYFITKSGEPLLYDPAIYFGHREIDIAMTRLFGGFSPDFYRSYNDSFSLESGWEDRTPFGQMYPNMVHLNIFGTAYLGAVKPLIDKF